MILWYDSPMRRPVPALLVSAGQREVLESVQPAFGPLFGATRSPGGGDELSRSSAGQLTRASIAPMCTPGEGATIWGYGADRPRRRTQTARWGAARCAVGSQPGAGAPW